MSNPKIFELRKSIASKKAEMLSLVEKEADLPVDESPSEEDTDRLTTLEKEVKTLEGRVSKLEGLDDSDAKVDDTDSDEKAFKTTFKQFTPVSKSFTQPAQQLEKGLMAARYLHGVMYAKAHGSRAAADMISKTYFDNEMAKTISVAGNGAQTVPIKYATDVIEYLRPLVAIRNAGATVIDTTEGNLSLPRQNATSTSAWQNELTTIGTSDIGFDMPVLSNHKLTTIVQASNDLLRRSPYGLDGIIRDDLVQSIARKEDIAFLRGDGGSLTPVTGLLNQTLVSVLSGSTLSNSLDMVTATIRGAKKQLFNNLSRQIRPAWIFNGDVANKIASVRDGVGGFPFRDDIDAGKLLGYPIFLTQSLPSNLTGYAAGGGGTAGSEIYLADFADVVIGQTMNVQVDVSTDAGNAFVQDFTMYRVITEVDMQLRHPGSVVVTKVDSWL